MAACTPSVQFVVEGPPVGKARVRVYGKRMLFFTAEKTRRYEKAIAAAFLQACRGQPDRPAATEIRVHCFFRNGVHPDLDNVLKSVVDALNGLAYKDDRYLNLMLVERGLDPQRPRIEVTLI